MVKVNVGLQVTMPVGTTNEQVDAWGALLTAQLQAVCMADVNVELYDEGEHGVELRVWVDTDPYGAQLLAALCELVSAGSAMIVQLSSATEGDVQQFVLACARCAVDVDMYWGDTDAEGIAYVYNMRQMHMLMGALR